MPSPVLCAVGPPGQPLVGVHAARRLAADLGARVRLVHVFDPMAVGVPGTGDLASGRRSTDDFVRFARVRAQSRLADASRLLHGIEHHAELREGEVVAQLLADAREHDAALLVTAPVGGTAVDWLLLGSVSAELAARSPCPVLVAREDAAGEDAGAVVCGYDGSHHGERAAQHAADLAVALGVDLVLAHVHRDDDQRLAAERALGEAAAALGTSATGEPLTVRVAVAAGDPAVELTRLADDLRARIVVAGTRGRGPVTSALLGSVSADLVRTARQPVLLVPATVGG